MTAVMTAAGDPLDDNVGRVGAFDRVCCVGRLRCAGRFEAAFRGLFEFNTRLRPVVPRVDAVFTMCPRTLHDYLTSEVTYRANVRADRANRRSW